MAVEMGFQQISAFLLKLPVFFALPIFRRILGCLGSARLALFLLGKTAKIDDFPQFLPRLQPLVVERSGCSDIDSVDTISP